LQKGGKLAFALPASATPPTFDEYVSDPARPVPYTNTLAIDYPRDFPVEDQRFLTGRPDVLVYQSDVLAKDLTVVGPVRVELHVATSGTDADWVVKLIDVLPDDSIIPERFRVASRRGGYQQLVRGEVMRGKFRDSFERPVPFRPGEPSVVRFALQDVYHTFRPGHRIMVQIQSSWFPLVDRNPQTFVDIYNARESDFRKAVQRVYHTVERASRLEFLVLP
jgi:hypothetical protein